MKKQSFKLSEVEGIPSPRGRARVGANKKAAFTLAEVLITLGIIGVVAAMTMPTLIGNYQKHVYANQMKKTYSTLYQGLQKMLADEGVTQFEQTELMKIAENRGSCLSTADSDEQKSVCNNDSKESFYNVIKKYIKVTDFKKISQYSYKYLNNESESPISMSNNSVIILSDGSIMISAVFENRDDGSLWAAFSFDINGLKGPNIFGRDIFQFDIAWNKLYPRGSKAYSSDLSVLFGGGNKNLREWENGSKIYNCRTDIISNGTGCAGRIMDKGKMDY